MEERGECQLNKSWDWEIYTERRLKYSARMTRFQDGNELGKFGAGKEVCTVGFQGRERNGIRPLISMLYCVKLGCGGRDRYRGER